MTSSAILDLINMYFGSSMTIITKKMIENVKLRQIIAENNFPGIFQQKENFFENLTCGCHGNTLVGVTTKSTNLAKITLLVSMETWSHDHSDKS